MELPISFKYEFSLSDAPVFELEDPSPDQHSLDRSSLPEVYSENLPKAEDRPRLFYMAFFFSLLIHFLLLLGLTFANFNPDKRPVKEVDTWVVNLVPFQNSAPKGLKEGPAQNILSEPKAAFPRPNREGQVLPPPKMSSPEESDAATLESNSPLPNAEPSAAEESPNPSLSSETGDKEVLAKEHVK